MTEHVDLYWFFYYWKETFLKNENISLPKLTFFSVLINML